MKFLAFSKGILAISYLEKFLQAPVRAVKLSDYFISQKSQKSVAVIGWGMKETSKKARSFAHKKGLNYVALEDGFLRSFFPSAAYPPLSLVVDKYGIYYDSHKPSELEYMLNSAENLLSGVSSWGEFYDQTDLKKAIALICEYGLSKYNHAPDLAEIPTDPRSKVLVIDQTKGDKAIELANANETTFTKMLQQARADNPDSLLVIKTHPEVVSGAKSGHFSALVEDENTLIIRSNVSPKSLFDLVDKVYTVSSTMGFEALLFGKQTHCFGCAWYSGYGATVDYIKCERRTVKRNVHELFAAAYFRYARYLNTTDCELGSIFDVIETLKLQKEIAQRYPKRLVVLGFRKWKQYNFSTMLNLNHQGVVFAKNLAKFERKYGELTDNDELVVWGASFPKNQQNRWQQHNLTRLEDGFLRSVGLGSDLVKANSIALDRAGIYFDPLSNSDIKRCCYNGLSETQRGEVKQLIELIKKYDLTKYNVDASLNLDFSHPSYNKKPSQKIILVIGQVEDDASILLGSPKINTNLALIKAARDEFKQDFIVYKPHPDVSSGNRKGVVKSKGLTGLCDFVALSESVISLIKAADVVYCMTSLSGVDALLRDKKVIVWGRPFYAGYGLTEDRISQDKKPKLDLYEFIYASFFRYPLYYNHQLKIYTTPKAAALELIRQKKNFSYAKKTKYRRYIERQFYKLKVLAKAFFIV